MEGRCVSSDQVFAELIGMGFEFSDVAEAVKAVGPSVETAVEYILNGSRRNSTVASTSSKLPISNTKALGKRTLSTSCSSYRMRQSTIKEHLQSAGRPKRSKTDNVSDVSVSGSQLLLEPLRESDEPLHAVESNLKIEQETFLQRSPGQEELDIGPGWEQKVKNLLLKHFGFSSLKSFQKDAVAAWLARRDCLVLAATGSGKSLCFQIPALLTGKVVVAISPLISLMHDQCLKLAKHGVSACFLGSGQTDSTIEQKAMRGMYDIIYVCPETILRLIKPLQSLAESRGIALFAIDEVHCVSKWGHDFRPDYRRLSVLRENFRADKLKFLRFDIPLMALTATATAVVREDILSSLCMSNETLIVLTSFFRPNLRFSVKDSRTSSPKSYVNDFRELIDIYTRKKRPDKKEHDVVFQDMEHDSDSSTDTSNASIFDADKMSQIELDNVEDQSFSEKDDDVSSAKESRFPASDEKKLSVEYLEDECDLVQGVDDMDVSCGEFFGKSPDDSDIFGSSEKYDLQNKEEERLKLRQGHLEGPTIIYVPTRKETVSIANFLCKFGVKAAAYNAKLAKGHLRQVHHEFHENALEVVVATIAFGMGIDKSNVRRIIHYGWPQSLEAYYQEAGRAGRDGKSADCILYANLSRIPSLLPSRRSEDQTKQAYKMLSDCFRYGMNTSNCRAKILVEYFGEEFSHKKCQLCDVCVNAPPEMVNLKAEADAFMRVVAAHYGESSAGSSYDNVISVGNNQVRHKEKPNILMFVGRIREQFPKFIASDRLWWQGLARILADKGFIREGGDMIRVQIKFPEPTKLGLEFLNCNGGQPFYIYPEADMLLSMRNDKPYSSFSEWGKGWADPEIRRQRLGKMRVRRNPRKRRSRKRQPDPKTARGRLAAKLSKQK
ncbi:ATP-dependent DNA helicase Q-like SIM isoform X1 [Rhododendron vialii]|uniref:ATP-dependent DNA helicase Q-like SIM isoform X1 n=1 Tax=Rhododendron vialii TaxID=182163 RepID=UPI00265ED695|nr:ATP-dependent DNA helicase Q-like SIM isoform X1 [Rhododendron vialii]